MPALVTPSRQKRQTDRRITLMKRAESSRTRHGGGSGEMKWPRVEFPFIRAPARAVRPPLSGYCIL